MDPRNPPELLGRKLELHRRFFSFLKNSRTEEELVHFVVDWLAGNFPDCRASFAEMSESGRLTLHYERGHAAVPSVKAWPRDLGDVSELFPWLTEQKALVVGEGGPSAGFPLKAWKVLSPFTGVAACVHHPLPVEEGKIGILSLLAPGPRRWAELDLELVGHLAELLHLFVRESRAQQALRHSEYIFRQFTDHIDAVFWMADPENKESIYVSPAYDRIWGSSREVLKDKPQGFLEAIIEEDRARVIEDLKKHQIGPSEKHYRIRQPGGAVRWIKDRSFPIRNEQGEVYRVVGIAEDVTPLREAREKLESTQAQIVSNAKFAALGEMASGMAHEINNPLAVILGTATQMRNRLQHLSLPDPTLQDYLATIDKMTKRIAGIIKGLRTFSRQTDRDPLVPADLCAILQDSLAICSSAIRAGDITLSVSPLSEPFWIKCRPSEISQVLVNLINNAKDAVSRCEIREIKVNFARTPMGVCFSVEDSGPGVAPEIREKIFQPFFTTKEVGSGTGLGLSISKGIVEAHGGRLYLEIVGGKPRFVVELPGEAR